MKKSYIFFGIFFIILITTIPIFLISQKNAAERNDDFNKDNVIIKNQRISLVCNIDNDCVIIDKDINYRVCWPGACEKVDYSLDKYIAVNEESYEKYKESESKFRPSIEECGPMPGCPTWNININFDAKCLNQQCKKIPR